MSEPRLAAAEKTEGWVRPQVCVELWAWNLLLFVPVPLANRQVIAALDQKVEWSYSCSDLAFFPICLVRSVDMRACGCVVAIPNTDCKSSIIWRRVDHKAQCAGSVPRGFRDQNTRSPRGTDSKKRRANFLGLVRSTPPAANLINEKTASANAVSRLGFYPCWYSQSILPESGSAKQPSVLRHC